jgi:hypothetical protein
MQKKSIPPSAPASDRKKRRGIQASLENLLQKFIEYMEAVLLFAQRHTELFLRRLIFKGIWFICLFFTICIGFGYLSFATFLTLQQLGGLNSIYSSLITGLLFLSGSYIFLKVLLRKDS